MYAEERRPKKTTLINLSTDSDQVHFAYDLNGNLTSWTDRKNQVTTYTYDALDRQTFAGFGTTGLPPTYQSTNTYTYDAGNRLTQVVDSASGAITRTYDLLDRLTSETTPEGSISYTYDSGNRRATMTVAGETAVSSTFDNADRLTSITQGIANVTIAYDNADRRTSLTLPNGVVMEYAYDTDSRLTGITYKLGTQTLGTLTYSHDPDGRRTAVSGTWARTNLPAALTSATYDNANQIATFGGTTFTYDANGNITNDGNRTYTWSARDQLTSLGGPFTASFAYDGLGRRRSKTVAGAATQFLYDGLNPVQELVAGSPTANLLTGLEIDEFFSRTDSNGSRHFSTDALGSTLALSDNTGSVLTEYTYEPFGAVSVTGSSTNNSFAFTGRETDNTGLFYYRARYYDPHVQRFTAEDQLGFDAGDVNLHSYVFNSPANAVDPTGNVSAYFPQCDPRSPLNPKFFIPWIRPVLPAITFLFGDPCDDLAFLPNPLAFRPPMGPLRRIPSGIRRFARRVPSWVGPNGPIFGRQHYRGGNPGWLNRGPVRLGWYWDPSGVNRFGVHWGSPSAPVRFPWRWHIPLGPTAPDMRPPPPGG